ncbi:hypothetical protein OIU78_019684 [Salix suchowensis]|nr:hypothetical protein OIU78_019684 [Salix suchowensis]
MFETGFHVFIKRAVVIGNGFAGAENQCIGLLRALGLSSRYSLHRVMRPRGAVNEWLHWLPVSVHKKVDNVIRKICDDSRCILGKKVMPALFENDGKNAGLLGVLEADANQIAKMARETFDRDGPLLVVASGRDTISVASSIRQLAPESVFVVQIQHPRLNLNRFDLVITPCHDYYPLTPEAQDQIPWFLRSWITPREPPDSNVVLTVGALHQADSAALRIAASLWHDELAPLLKPLLVVNIGGPTSKMLCICVHYLHALFLEHSFGIPHFLSISSDKFCLVYVNISRNDMTSTKRMVEFFICGRLIFALEKLSVGALF